MPGVDLLLNFLAFLKQFAIFRSKIVNDACEFRPEALRVDAGARGDVLVDELEQLRCNGQAVALDSGVHGSKTFSVLEMEK